MKGAVFSVNDSSSFSPSTSRALDEHSTALDSAALQARDELSVPLSTGLRLHQAFSELASIHEESSEDGWDGYNAKAVGVASASMACAFLMALPPWVATPKISPDPDGEISFDWTTNTDDTLSVSVRDDGRLSWAMLKDGESAYGTVIMADSIPYAISSRLAPSTA